MTATHDPTALPAWQALAAHRDVIAATDLRRLFAADPGRGERMTLAAAGVHLDYSKHRITDETLRLLVALAEQAGVRARIDAMFAGEKINETERRAVLHVALRAPAGQQIFVDGRDVVPEVHAVLDKMARSFGWKGRARRNAIHMLAATTGALVLARAVDDPALSKEILDSVREDLSAL